MFSVRYELRHKRHCGYKHLTLYEKSTQNRLPRPLRDKRRNHDVSPFAIEVQEIRHLDFYEISKRNKQELKRPEKQLTVNVKYKIYHPTRKNESSGSRLGYIECIHECSRE